MAAYCIKNGKLYFDEENAAPENGAASSYLFRPDGTMEPCTEKPELKSGEGYLLFSEGFYAEPLEMLTDYSKSENAEQWLSYMALRHIERVRFLDENLLVRAELKE